MTLLYSPKSRCRQKGSEWTGEIRILETIFAKKETDKGATLPVSITLPISLWFVAVRGDKL